jgi:hypothetical protein
MSWLVSRTTEGGAAGQHSETLPPEIGIVVTVLVLLLLVHRELVRAAGPSDEAKPLRAMWFAVAPLLLAFATILLVRLGELL